MPRSKCTKPMLEGQDLENRSLRLSLGCITFSYLARRTIYVNMAKVTTILSVDRRPKLCTYELVFLFGLRTEIEKDITFLRGFVSHVKYAV